MKVTGNTNIPGSVSHTNKKSKSKKASPFGNDAVQLGNKPEKKMGLTQAQMKDFFNAKTKDILSEAQWDFKDTGLSNVEYQTMIPISDNSVCVRTGNGMARLDGDTGKVKWESTTPLQNFENSIIETADGTIVGAGDDAKLHGMDPKTGKQLWEFDLGTKFKSPMKTTKNGELITFCKDGDHLSLTRLNPDGTVKSSAKLGFWCKPIDEKGFEGHFINEEKNGDFIVHASVLEKKKVGTNYVPMHNTTFRVTPDGEVKWGSNTMDPAASFESAPDNFFMVSYDEMAHFDKNTGQKVFTREKKHERYDPKYGGIGDTRFEIGGQHKYKYLKYFGAKNDRVYIQGYCEGPLRTTKSGEELLCVDAKNPDNVYWRKDSWGSVFNGPLYTDDNLILHVSDEDKGTVEALDPMTGNAMWALDLKDQNLHQKVKQMPKGTQIRIREEKPDRYKVKKAKDGTLFIRTLKNVFGIDPNNGKVKYTIKSQDALGEFQLNGKEDTVFAENLDNQGVQAFSVVAPEDLLSFKAEKLTKQQEAEGEKQDLSIKVEEKQVSIGGVTLKRNK